MGDSWGSSLFGSLDADTLREREALLRIVRPFLEDSSTVSAGGIVRIANGFTIRNGRVERVGLPRNHLTRFQVPEYVRAFLSGRMGWDAPNAVLVVSGAFGVFERSTVVAAGGYSADTVGEDMELVVRLRRHCREEGIPYRIGFVLDPVAWTECPETLRGLGRHRDRWQRGLLQLFPLGTLENVGFREFTTFWPVRGPVSGTVGREGWGEIARRGFSEGTKQG